jgi:serine/threonine protein kinase/predicted Zn-dependent protease
MPDDDTHSADPGRTPPERPEPSRSVDRLGDFEILREIGRGGMGVVHEARQVSLNRRVALKVLPPGLGLTETAVRRFGREARAAAKLHHTNIVPVYAIGEEEGCHFYAMELVEGDSLSHILNDLRGGTSNPLLEATVARTSAEDSPKQTTGAAVTTSGGLSETGSGSREWFDAVARLLAEVADGLDYAHGRGIVHRDVKPANLILSKVGRLCITDFGLARVTEEPGMTVSGSFLGTPAYMSPEQIAAGRITVDHRTDVYSLGAVLYEMLTLRRPFPGENREEILSGILTRDPRAPRRVNPRIPVDLETICHKAMEKDPRRRYQTAGEMAQDLRQFLQRGLIAARRAGPVRRVGKFVRRHPVATVLVAAVILVAGLGTLVWRTSVQKAEHEFQSSIAVAQYSLEQGEYREALRSAERAHTLDPSSDDARVLRARALLHLGRGHEAVAEAGAVLEQNPDDWVAHLVIVAASKGVFGGRTRVYGDDPRPHVEAVGRLAPDTAEASYLRALVTDSDQEALSLLGRALDQDPGFTEAMRARIYVNLRLKDFHAGLADADRLVTAHPKSGVGRRHRAMCYFFLHDGERALAEVDRAIELDPEDAWNYFSRGRILRYFFSDLDGALENMSRAIELDPDGALFLHDRASIRYASGRYTEALEDIERTLELTPDSPDAARLQARAHYRLGQESEARQLLEQLEIKVETWSDPEARAEVHREVARMWVEFGDLEKATALTGRAVELDPEGWRNYLYRARGEKLTGDEESFRADCDRAARFELEGPEELSSRAWMLSTLCDRKDLAISDLTRALETAPTWADAYNARALQYMYLGDFERSLPDLDRCVRYAEKWPMCYRNRILMNRRVARIDEALRDSDRFIELTPDNFEGPLIKSTLLVQLGRMDDALEQVDRALALAPANSDALIQRASYLALQPGNCSAIEEDIEQIVETESKNVDRMLQLAMLHVDTLIYGCPDLYDPEFALASARKAEEDNPNSEVLWSVLGVALYRNGLFEEAIEYQKRSAAAYAEEAYDLFFLAMQHWKAGHASDARNYYDRAVVWMDQHGPNDPQLKLFRREAEELLDVQP